MVTFNFAQQYKHDISGVENPNEWVYESKIGVYRPVHLLSDCLICRPMYKTEPNFRKGMTGIYYKGELIKRHYDIPRIPNSHAHLPFIKLGYHDIDWELAGYGKNP